MSPGTPRVAEDKWWQTVYDLEQSLLHPHRTKTCKRCGSTRSHDPKYRVHETESWMPTGANLPGGRWALSAQACTLADARKLRFIMGERATIWVRVKKDGSSSSFELLAPRKSRP